MEVNIFVYREFPIILITFFDRDQRLAIKAELQIRKKAMQIDNFPSQEVINEFFQEPSDLIELDLRWKQPNLLKFLVNFYLFSFFISV